jgi:GT2 family glycosyltransferase
VKLAIGIPTLNRYDLLKSYLPLYLKDFPNTKIYILDNGNQEIPTTKNIEVIKKDNISVGASWNVLCETIFKEHDTALILNDDVYLGKNIVAIDMLLHQFRHFKGVIRSTPDWCAFIITNKIFNKVGQFDECFYPAYYEDNSYDYRMKLLGIGNSIKTPYLNPVIYNSSMTIEKSPEILEASKKNKKLYIKMWGGEPERETFKTPYNE